MSKKIWTGVALTAALIVTGWWFLERSTRPTSKPDSVPALQLVSNAPPNSPVPITATTAPAAEKMAATRVPDAPVGPAGLESPPENPPTNVLPTAGDILAEPGDDYVKIAKKLGALTLETRAPMENRREALAHTLNLSVGHEAEVLIPLVKDSRLPDELAEDILSEALNRPLSFQADLYVEALATRTAPELSLRIRQHLMFLTDGPDLGPVGSAWWGAVAKAKAGWK